MCVFKKQSKKEEKNQFPSKRRHLDTIHKGVALYLSYCDYVCIEQLHEKNASSEMTPRMRKLTLVNDFFCLLRLSAPSDRAVI